eukprot:gene54505-66627_t
MEVSNDGFMRRRPRPPAPEQGGGEMAEAPPLGLTPVDDAPDA